MSPGWAAACVAVAALRSQQVMQTLEEAFASGTLVHKSGGVVCACSPAKRFKAGWGPKACEWKDHQHPPGDFGF